MPKTDKDKDKVIHEAFFCFEKFLMWGADHEDFANQCNVLWEELRKYDSDLYWKIFNEIEFDIREGGPEEIP